MYANLVRAILAPIVAFLLQLALTAIGIELDPLIFNSIVAAIVTWFLVQFGLEVGFRAGFLARDF